MHGQLEIRVLGDFAVLRGGAALELPPSRKTRALLAYLAVTGHPQRRERLCEMFWEIPDDPRGALRWSLSKIRQILKPGAEGNLQADRNMVSLSIEGIDLDILPLKGLTPRDVDGLETERLEDFAARFRGGFLEGIGLPRCPDFEAWRIALADEMEVLRLRVLRVLVTRLATSEPAAALNYAYTIQALSDDDLALKAEIGRLAEAARQDAAGAYVAATPVETTPPAPQFRQEIRHCTTRDGIRIAYALSGEGPPLVRAAHWMSHLEHDWHSPVWAHWLEGLSARHKLIRYDERGNGLSDWNVEDLSFGSMVADLESITDAAGLRQFCLLGVSQSCAVSVAYAVRYPERLTGLILYGGYVQGWRARGEEQEIRRREAMGTLIRDGWGQQDPMFRQLFTSLFIPGATQEQMDWFNELQRQTVSPDNALRFHEAFGRIDVTELLPRVSVPTLVIHARDDRVVPLEAGRALASGIPEARLVVLDGANHILLAHEPAFEQFLAEVERFSADPVPSGPDPTIEIRLDRARRQITVLTAEVISPLQAFESYDPELVLREIGPLVDQVVKTIASHQGVATVGVDGSVTALFGLSKVTENHAHLACRAALAAVAAIEELALGRARLRIGIDSGEVIARQREVAGGAVDEVVGAAPRQAGRLMQALRRATVAMTTRARAAAGGYVRTIRLSPSDHPALGRDERAWELVGENRALSRWYLRVNQGMSGLVGREVELAALRACWRRAREGHGQAVGIVADPGLGKSRLVHEFISSDEVAGLSVLESGALELDAEVGYLVIKKLVQAACGFDEGVGAAIAEERLARLCTELRLAGIKAPLAGLLDLPLPDTDWVTLDAAERNLRICNGVHALLANLSRQTPIVVLIEDLHWMDPASELVLQRLLDTIAGLRILVILTYRPTYRPGWLRRGILQQLRLEPFDRQEAEYFLDGLLGKDPSLDRLKPMLIEQGESTPLYLEEMVRVLEAQGRIEGALGSYHVKGDISEVSVPDTLRAVISARIGQLSPVERRLVQLAAVIGRDQPKALLQALSSLPRETLDAALANLRDMELLFEIQSYPTVELSFKHALIQKIAYSELLEQDRKLVHRSTLRAMEHLYRDSLAEHIERLAEHALRAEEWDQAVPYLVQASDRAVDQSGYERAARFLENALRAADAQAPTREKLAWKIDIRTRLRPVYEALGAFSKAVNRLDEARRFSEELGDEKRLFSTLIHQSYLYSAHGRVEEALEAADNLKQRATRHEEGLRYICEADLAAAQAYLMRADARAAIERLRPHYDVFTTLWRHDRFGQLGVRSVWYLGHLAQAEATLGNFEEATSAAVGAREIADESRRPIDIAGARYFAAMVDVLRGPTPEQREELRALTGSGSSNARSVRPWLQAVLGHIEFALGDYEEARNALESVLTELDCFDLPQFECYARAVLACTRARLGEPESAANLEYALKHARALKAQLSEIIALRGLAEIAGGEEAIALLTEACRLAEEHGYRPDLARTLYALGIAEQRAGRASALATQQRAAELIAEMGLRMSTADAPRPTARPARRRGAQSAGLTT